MVETRTDLRNIAIIAHVDHGKTTLVDKLLRQASVFRENEKVVDRVLDSNDLERERGITILAKNTSVSIWDEVSQEQVKINIVDTPGHADFGGEVERVMNMVDGVLLLVDAAEGPMPQTRFVLKKALEVGHKAIVVINKVDRKDAEPERVLNETFDLFIELGASEIQADFPIIYAQATEGKSGLTLPLGPDLKPLFQTIFRDIPAPTVDLKAPLKILVTALGYDEYRGVSALGRISTGRITAGQQLARITREGKIIPEQAKYLYVHDGLDLVEINSASAGEIVSIVGLENILIGETLADINDPQALPIISIEEPTVRMTFGVNTSIFSGREGRWGTSRKIRERLFEELRRNVSLRVEEMQNKDSFLVSGRGELHLAILIETMRREGYEFQVSRPEVIFKTGPDGEILEPFEEVQIEAVKEVTGSVVEMLGMRRGKMIDMRESDSGTVRMQYIVPTRGLLGFRYQFLTATRGLGVMNTVFHGYDEMVGDLATRSTGSLVSWETGVANTYGLKNAEERGTLFITPGTEVYAGMVVGEHAKSGDITINVCKKKQLTNMRQSNRDIDVRLTPARDMSLDEKIEYMADDELLEITPKSIRIRKRILDAKERNKHLKKDKPELETHFEK